MDDRALQDQFDEAAAAQLYRMARMVREHAYASLTVSPSLNGCTVTVEYPEPLLGEVPTLSREG